MAVQRVEIPISFQYATVVYTATSSGGSPTQATTVLQPPPNGTSVSIIDVNTSNPATVYLNSTGSSTITSPATDAGGNVNGWLVEGNYQFTAAANGPYAGATVYWNAVRGDGVENLFPGSVTTADIASGAITLSTLATAVAQALVPTGAITAFGGTTAPSGYLLCNGAVVSQTTYSALFGVIGSAYNSGGEGSGNFRLPDLRGRWPLGKAASGTGSTLGATGGDLDHTHHVEDVDIGLLDLGPIATAAFNIPPHTHTLAGGAAAVSINESPDGRAIEQHYQAQHPTLTVSYTSKHLNDLVDRPIQLSSTETHPATQLVGATDNGGDGTFTASVDPQLGAVGTWSGSSIGHKHVPSHDTDSENPAYQVVNYIIKT